MRILGALIARHPSVAGGTASFLVIFGFVSANAVWYQHGAHPAPLFSTRDRLASMKKVAVASAKPAPAGLTVDDLLAGARPPQAAARPAPDTRQTASIPAPAGPAAGGDPLIAGIQKALAERDFYQGPVDGRDGIATRAAIQAFQAATSRPLTGKPSPSLLSEIRATQRKAVAIPRSRPGDQPPAADDEIARILAMPPAADVPTPKPAPTPASTPTPAPATASHSAAAQDMPSDLVARIQTGLRNIAYSNVAVDGIAGARTKAAIRNFEKNYRLPPTGEPNRRVLEKLKSIGAL